MYIGYFGAGVGILVLALLAFFGMEDINAMNGIKVLLVQRSEWSLRALRFLWAGMIVWPPGAINGRGLDTGRLWQGVFCAENESSKISAGS